MELSARDVKAKASAPQYLKSKSDKIFEEIRSGAYEQASASKAKSGKQTGKRTTKEQAPPVREIQSKTKKIKKEKKQGKRVLRLRGKTLDLKKMGALKSRKKAKQPKKKVPKRKIKASKKNQKKTPKAASLIEVSSCGSASGRSTITRRAKQEAANSIKKIYRKK